MQAFNLSSDSSSDADGNAESVRRPPRGGHGGSRQGTRARRPMPRQRIRSVGSSDVEGALLLAECNPPLPTTTRSGSTTDSSSDLSGESRAARRTHVAVQRGSTRRRPSLPAADEVYVRAAAVGKQKDSRATRRQQPPQREGLMHRYAEFADPSRTPRGAGRKPRAKRRGKSDADSMASSAESMSHLPVPASLANGLYHQRRSTATFADQLFATLSRSFNQMLCRKCDLAMELIVPLMFILVALLLWAVWGNKKLEDHIYVNYSSPKFFTGIETREDLLANFCYGPGASEPTAGLLPCNGSLQGFICDGVDTYVPLKGDALCVYGTSFKDFVFLYLLSTRGNLTRIPSLDSMILLQWSAMKAGSLLLSDKFGATFITNRQFFAIDKAGLLYLAGSDDAVLQALEKALIRESYFFPHVYGGRFASVAAAKSEMRSHAKNWGIVELREFTTTSYDVVIHLAAKGMADTTIAVDVTYSGGQQENGADLYLASGFLTLAERVSEFYLAYVHNTTIGAANFVTSSATPAYSYSPMLRQAYGLIPLMFVLAFLYPVSQQTKRIVLEKEMRIREAMLIMGMKDSALYISTFITDGALLTVVSLASTVMVRATFLSNSDVWCIFLFFWLYAMTTIPLSGLLASFFSKARLASMMAPVIYFLIVMPTFVMTNASSGAIVGFAFLSPSGFASIVSATLRHRLGGGFSSEDLHNPFDNPTVAVLLGILAADFVIYYLLALYFDAVLPKDWGTSKHPLFFIVDPYKACCGKKGSLHGGPDGRAVSGVYEESNYGNDVVQLQGLRKEYKRGGRRFTAVENLYWGMREGEISVLLGHNGAGKTTALNMMTGMIEPDEGDCLIYGLSVRQELSDVRNEIGYCPQHNILWPELTCREHLEFFGKIKGLKGWRLENAVCRMLHETDLFDKMDYPSKALSGGQKRKLSIAVAFVGGSRLVFLDEPTAGMDVGARRHVWSLLKSMADFHTILLTTHFMDEADLLGHRIGIMSQGRLQCSGTSMFLKSNLGVGYSITISVNPETEVGSIDELVTKYVDGAGVLSHNGCELSYQLPMESAQQFPALLGAVESQDTSFGIRGYSLSATTLEEVFLKVSEDKSDDNADPDTRPPISPIWEFDESTGPIALQMRAMFKKRFWNAMRDRRMQCFQIICPVICVLVAMLLSLIHARGPEVYPLDHSVVYAAGKTPPFFPTAQCDVFWGAGSVPVPGAQHKEMHFANAESLSDCILDQWFFHTTPLYGAIACEDRNLAVFSRRPLSNVFVYNASGPHQSGINLATYYDMVARKTTSGAARMKLNAGIIYDDKDTVQDPMKLIVTGLLIMIPFAFLPSNPVAWIVKERECGAMHQQVLASINFYVYWFCNFVFDLAAYLISAMLIVAIFAIFQKSEFIGEERAGVTVTVFVVFGFASTAMAYLISFCFKEHSTAQIATMGGSFVVAFLFLIITYVLALEPKNEALSNKLRWFFRLMPTFCVGECILQELLLDQLIAAGQATGAWDMQPFGQSLIYLSIEFPVFAILALLLDHPTLRRRIQRCRYSRDADPIIPSDEDSDVEDEREAVYEAADNAADNSDVLRVIDLQKRYPNGKIAVKGVTFSIFPGEVFGFLGTNGAGKTTTMSMLCQQFMPTGGSAWVDGHDIVDETRDAMRCIGYCPQFDATFDLLTVEEHLEYYASLNGVAASSRDSVVNTLLQLCELTKYRDSQAGQLSGGNRRKLSVAISLMGGPEVIFLDEPSAGMDPVARRGLWTAIQRAAKHCSVVLTTHHLEEVEALADIVAIMVDGSLRCIGDKIHLKNKYGSGFEMSIRVASEDHCRDVESFVKREMPDAVLSEYKSNRYVYSLPSAVPLSHVFNLIQANKDILGITDYCVSQTSIEQVFLKVGESALGSSDG